MNAIDAMILFIIIYNIALFGCFVTLIYMLIKYVFKLNNIEFESLKTFLIIITFVLVGVFLLPYLLVLIFSLIMFIFYTIIKTIVPETGFPTLFIPVRELLMKIPPLQTFEDRGIFRIFSSSIELLGMNSSFKDGLKNFLGDYYLFSKNNSYELVKLYNPHIDIENFKNVIENMTNNNKTQELNNINNDIDVCVGSSSELTTPDMNYLNIFKNNINDMKTTFKCNLNTLPAYIST